MTHNHLRRFGSLRLGCGPEIFCRPVDSWTISNERFEELDSENPIWWGAKGAIQPRLKRFLSDVRAGVASVCAVERWRAGTRLATKNGVGEIVQI
jgi:hypothetical protein